MTSISSGGLRLPDRTASIRSPVVTARVAAAPSLRQNDPAAATTRVTWGSSEAARAVYSDPRGIAGGVRLWSSPVQPDDNVSAVMARNQNLHSPNLSDQWRGLGGALLTRFAGNGANFSQALVDQWTHDTGAGVEEMSEAEMAQRASEVALKQAAAVQTVADGAPTAGLKILTRSGQTVELNIAVNSGLGRGEIGMKVEIKSSGQMSAEERSAIENLASGLDRALEGLGRDDAVDLDLSGLVGYDRSVLASVDLAVKNTRTHQMLRSFSLHLGDDRQSVSLKGYDGDIDLNVAPVGPMANASAQQRSAAIQQTLERFDRAGERGHASRGMVQQMKALFQQVQGAARSDEAGRSDGSLQAPDALDGSGVGAASPSNGVLRLSAASAKKTSVDVPIAADVASKLTGLADFDASMAGETHRSNRSGTVHSAGHIDYTLSQKTTSKDGGDGKTSTAQTVSEQLSADFKTANGNETMLNVLNGNHSTTRVRDRATVTTLIESATEGITRVLRRTDEQQFKSVTELQDHKVVGQHSWPAQRSFIEQLREGGAASPAPPLDALCPRTPLATPSV